MENLYNMQFADLYHFKNTNMKKKIINNKKIYNDGDYGTMELKII